MPGPREQRFGPDWLEARLGSLLPEPPRGFCLAWSGGADSTALAAALVALRDAARLRGERPLPLRAIHVDHGLQAAAAQFRTHCRRQARRWHLPLTLKAVEVDRTPGRSVEEAAREARYAALREALAPGECLLTAQHAGDQLETFLLQALRGAGLAGLAAMPESARFGAGLLLRPLLPLSRATLLDYLKARGIGWVEDPSNEDLRFDRNYLRQAVLRPLLARWPAAERTVARSARHAAGADALLAERASRDAAAAADGPDLDIRVLRRLGPARQGLALRAWLIRLGLPVPDERRLGELLRLLDVRDDAQPVLHWPGAEVRRHQGRLLALRPVAKPGPPPGPSRSWRWSNGRPLSLPGGGSLALRRDDWGDVDLARLPGNLQVGTRAGAPEDLAGCDLKALLRESGIPAWERDAVPLLFAGKRLLAVADLWCHGSVMASPESTQRGRFVWRQR